jgi:nucleoside 2-deoxyribosyltransferase
MNRPQHKIYSASKIWHAPEFQNLRDKDGYNIISRWIDLDNDSDFVVFQKDQLWIQCLEDCLSCDLMIIYCKNFDEQQRGVLVELGHVIGAGKPVYCINDCETFQLCKTSDVAFTHHPNWHWVNDVSKGRISAKMGFWRAISHFNRQEKKRLAA